MFRLCSLIACLSLAIVTPQVVHAETPIAINYVRSFDVDGWNFLCFGDEWDVGSCTASRKLGRATVQIKADRYGFSANISGKCVKRPVETTGKWNLENGYFGHEAKDLVDQIELLSQPLKRNCVNVSASDLRESLKLAVVYLLEFAK